MSASTRSLATLQPTITRRRRTRSTIAPASSATMGKGSRSLATISPTAAGPA